MKNPKVRLTRIEEIIEQNNEAPTPQVLNLSRVGFSEPAPREGKRVLMAGLEFVGLTVPMSFIYIPFACLPQDAKIGDEFFLFVEKSID